MTTSQILVLAQAGFNAKQIAALSHLEQSENSVVQPQPQPQPQPQNQVQYTTQFQPMQSESDKVIDAVSQMLTSMNIRDSVQPVPQTTNDILAEIINPPGLIGEK